jgi:hypothetical protein
MRHAGCHLLSHPVPGILDLHLQHALGQIAIDVPETVSLQTAQASQDPLGPAISTLYQHSSRIITNLQLEDTCRSIHEPASL